ncbi:MAG: N-acetylmuramoyl-L-alanine amidase [Treponema sp.]|nr:N-acetylmuramoyl-L-alanine amidase [Treponema sp.]
MKYKLLTVFLLVICFPAIITAQISGSSAGSQSLGQITQNIQLRWDPFFGSGVLSTGDHYAAFFAGSAGEEGPVLFDNREILNLPLPYQEGGELRFPEAFVLGVNSTFTRLLEDELSRFRIAAIVIDPGHGGNDSGASATHNVNGTTIKSIEKDIVLRVSQLLYARLSAAYPDKVVMLTRDGDYFVTLEDRTLIANGIPMKDNEAIIFVSVHANSTVSNPSARGYEIWYLPPDYKRNLLDSSNFSGSPEILPILNDMMREEFFTESRLLSQRILNQFNEIFGHLMPSRGLKENDWFVVRNARMPSVLVELGFVSNQTDAVLMNDEAYLIKFAEALYNGITEFVTLFELSGGFTALY